MSKRGKKDTKTESIIVNLVIVLCMAYCCYVMFTKGLGGNMQGKTAGFRYFTIDSNILAAVSALIMLFARAVKGTASVFATVFKYVGTSAVTVTLITVLAFLGPAAGYKNLLGGINLYMHLVGPVLCIVSFCRLDRGPKILKSHIGSAFLPTFIYSIVYFVMVILIKKWPDFYGFNQGGKWYISAAVMYAGTLLIAVVLKALHNDR